MYGWNVTSGIIQVNHFYFTGNNNSIMIQRIDAQDASLYGTYNAFDYCLSFLFYGQQNLNIDIIFYDQNNKKLGVKSYRQSEFDSLSMCYRNISFYFQ